MPLNPGQRLGPYEVVGPLGAGGMGEVYKARDTRLDRTVALKVLPSALASDPEFKARFEREAKSVSALNHPHICTLFDVGEVDGASYLVLELLEGETLADRLKKGPVPVNEALELASQMADALDKAHRQGIIHRDLKPANVFLLRAAGASGTPHCKLLDFGLAKMGVAAPSGTIETKLHTAAPTGQTVPLTTQGSILGTFQYMAPEQIEGLEVDARSDIWGFGCVLYEMLTGKRAFEGKSQASLIATILERHPAPVAEVQPLTPPALGRLVRTCLEKNPDNRFHTAHDLWLHLQWIEEGGSAAGLPAPVAAGRKRRSQLMFAGAAVGLAAVAAIGAWMLKPAPPVTNVVTRFSHALEPGVNFSRTGRRAVAVSPDGTKVAFIANNQIYLRRVDQLEAQPIRGSDLDPLDLTFSPDGESLAFFALGTSGADNTSLRRIDVVGGKAVQICVTNGAPYGAKWEGDRIVFSIGRSIHVVPDTGGTPETVATAGAETLTQPQIVGGGRTLLYTVRTSAGADGHTIVAQPLGGGERKVLVDGGVDGRVLPTGHLIWTREDTLFAQAIDPETLELSGGPVALIEGVRAAAASSAAQLSVSATGTLVFMPGNTELRSDLVWVDRTAREEPTGAPLRAYSYPRVSPDGTRIVASTSDGDEDLWIWDLSRKTPTKFTAGPDADNYPVWTPDSRFVIYRSGPGGSQIDLYRRAADGTGSVERLTESPETESPQMILGDGRLLVRQTPNDTTSAQGTLFFLRPGQPTPQVPQPRPMTLEPVFATQPASIVSAEVSPDGRWIAYQSTEGSTRDAIHVRPFPDVDSGHWQISSEGGNRPMWSRSAQRLELFYARTNGAQPAMLMRVPVPAIPSGAAFSFRPPEEVLPLETYRLGAVGRGFDIGPDGRFLMVKTVGADLLERQSITVVSHWFDEVRARVKGK